MATYQPPESYSRPLSAKVAAACEAAEYPVCRCRCGGILHGVSHKRFLAAVNGELEDAEEIDRERCLELADELLPARLRTARAKAPAKTRRNGTAKKKAKKPAARWRVDEENIRKVRVR